jgi:predicted nucleic acid-binding protein
MYTLDANIFIRDLDTREPQHAECHTLLDELHLKAHYASPTLLICARSSASSAGII